MNRRFLYMVVWNWEAPFTQTLHRFNPSRLFFPNNHSPLDPAAAAAPVVENARLPHPAMTFFAHHPTEIGHYTTEMKAQQFMLLGRSKDKILVVGDCDGGQAAIFHDDGARGSFHVLPRSTRARARCSIETLSVAVGDGLYVANHGGGGVERSVEALVLEDPEEGWRYSCRALPPPPFVEKEQEDRPPPPAEGVAVGESSVWVSAKGHGTYALDMASGGGGAWSKVGDWALPFQGRAEYAPEHGLWFGFSPSFSSGDDDERSQLRTWDLLASAGGATPVARHAWGSVGAPAASPLHLVYGEQVAHLGGGGRFCVARFVEVEPRVPRGCCGTFGCFHPGPSRRFATFTGVEVLRQDEDEDGGGGLRLVEHKTCRYSLGLVNEEGREAQFVM